MRASPHRSINLGKRQDSPVPIDDVLLPPWAHSAEEFIRIHRAALESSYVSQHLHQWIDLVFGVKQQGLEAEAAFNLFSHITYYGRLDMEALRRAAPDDWKQAQDMLDNFGQTPVQLLTVPHRARARPPLAPPLPLFSYHDWFTPAGCRWLGAATARADWAPPELALYRTQIQLPAAPLFLASSRALHAVVALAADRSLSLHPVKHAAQRVTPFDIAADPRLRTRSCPVVTEPFSPLLELARPGLSGDQLVQALYHGKFLCVAGCWDRSLKIINVEQGTLELSISSGPEVVSCVSASRDGTVLVTGSLANSLTIYSLSYASGHPRVVKKQVLFGHDGAVTCVAVNKEMNLVCSGSLDGTRKDAALGG